MFLFLDQNHVFCVKHDNFNYEWLSISCSSEIGYLIVFCDFRQLLKDRKNRSYTAYKIHNFHGFNFSSIILRRINIVIIHKASFLHSLQPQHL